MNIELNPRKTLITLISITVILLFMHIIGLIITYKLELGSLSNFVMLFDFNTENNIPTLFSGFLLFLASLLLFIIAFSYKNNKNQYLYWIGLAIVFFFLMIDEIVSIHERIMWPIANYLNTTGIFFFAWIIPYGLFIIILGFIYFKFFLTLPKKTQLLFIFSAILFISGAIGLESLEGKHYELHGLENIYFSILYTFEETLEMLGVAIFIYALLSYISENIEKSIFSIRVKN